MNYLTRINHLRQFLQQKQLDAVFLTNPTNLIYYSGFQPLDLTDREAYIFITKDQAYILTSRLYAGEVKKYVQNLELKELSADAPLTKILGNIIKKEHIDSVGFEEENLLYSEYQKLSQKINNFVPIGINHLRVIKDQEELACIQKACDIGDNAFAAVLEKIKPGVTEEEVAFELELFMRKQHTIPSFPTIVAFGLHAAIPHHVTGKTVLQKNQFVLMDFGVKYKNYCSDMSRTVFVGTPSSEEKHMYQAVLTSQELAIEYIHNMYAQKKAIKGAKVDTLARDHIVEQGYPSFPHSLGHGIGLQVHEAPSLSPYSYDLLQDGMVFSVEPGMYIPDTVGIRIEDLVTIEKNAVKTLTRAPKKLIVL